MRIWCHLSRTDALSVPLILYSTVEHEQLANSGTRRVDPLNHTMFPLSVENIKKTS